MTTVRRLFVVVIAASIACGPTKPTRVVSIPNGVWGGDHVRLTVSDASASVEFDCAHGTLDAPLAVNQQGHFDVAGIFVREQGGPIRQGEVPEQHPARYTGTVKGRALTLTVIVTALSDLLGPFALVLDQPGRLVKCL